MKIANKISFSFFITAVILAVSSVIIFYLIGKGNLETAIFNHLITTLQSRTDHIETFLEHNKEVVRQFSKSIVIRRFLLASKEDEDYGRISNDIKQRLEDTSKILKCTYNLFVLDKDGMIVASSEKAEVGQDKSKDPYFLGAKESVFIKDAYVSTHKKIPSLAFSAPITDSKTGEFLGIVVGRSNLDKLNSITTDRTGLGKSGEIYVVNRNGYMITPSRFEEDSVLKLRIDTENTRMHDHIHRPEWIVIARIDEKEALAPLQKIKFFLISIIVITPILAWLIGIFVGGIISRPIYKLYKGAEIIGSGNLDYKVGTDAKDEVGHLSRTFDKMTEGLKGLLEKEKGFIVAQAEMAAEMEKAKELTSLNKELRRNEEELKKKVDDLEQFNKLVVGRELRMVDLKKEIDRLLKELGRSGRYGA